MAGNDDEDFFADLYDGDGDEPQQQTIAEPMPAMTAPVKNEADHQVSATTAYTEPAPAQDDEESRPFDPSAEESHRETTSYEDKRNRPVQLKDDGKMFIGGLNWETTDQSLKDYFSQFGEVTECTVMRDGATGRSRGFGFLTFRDPKTVNIVMVKEHVLDGKLIDPKRAIPRDEQEKTSKIFVGGVSPDANEQDFTSFFEQFGRVLDATLMMDKDTGRPRGFGFVTFDSDTAVDRTLEGPLEILGKPIEVKRAQPRNNVREEDDGSGGRGGRFSSRGGRGGATSAYGAGAPQSSSSAHNSMSQAQMAQWWMNMQNLWKMTQQNAMQQNPAMMQQMMAMQAQQNPAMMQQMSSTYQNNFQYGGGSPMNSGMGQGNFGNDGKQMQLEQQKYEQQQMARMQHGNFAQGNGSWDGMYDGEPAPANGGGGRGRGGFRGGRGGSGGQSPGGAAAPAGAPTGPKNAGRPGSNYRGGGRGGHRGYHPYARGGS